MYAKASNSYVHFKGYVAFNILSDITSHLVEFLNNRNKNLNIETNKIRVIYDVFLTNDINLHISEGFLKQELKILYNLRIFIFHLFQPAAKLFFILKELIVI